MIRRIAAACIAALFITLFAALTGAAPPAAAETTLQDMPALYDVVSPDKALIARDWPSPTGSEVGRIGPGIETVEVILAEPVLGWAMVNLARAKGWVRLSALKRRPDQWRDYALPGAMACFGTDPDWRLEMADATATLAGQNFDPQSFPVTLTQNALGRGDRWTRFAGAGDDIALVVARGLCGDGVTKREFGLTADLILRLEGLQPLHLAGCCSLQP